MAHENPCKKTTSRTARAYPRGPAPDMPRRARLCSARRALYFQIFVSAAFVRDGGWGPLRGVQPPRPLLWLKQAEEPVDRGLCEACPASVLIFSSNLCFMRALHVHAMPQRGEFPPRKLVRTFSEYGRRHSCFALACNFHASCFMHMLTVRARMIGMPCVRCICRFQVRG